MNIYLLSFLVTAFISLCFFKKKFWENRYLVLFIGGCVAIIAITTTNYFSRGNLPTKVEIAKQHQIKRFIVPETYLIDSVPFVFDSTKTNWSFANGFRYDTTVANKVKTIIFYDMDEHDDSKKIGYMTESGRSTFKYLKNKYIVPSPNDSTAFWARVKQNYVRDSKWVAAFSLPRKNTIVCFFIPPNEYALLPDSLIKELPFVINYSQVLASN